MKIFWRFGVILDKFYFNSILIIFFDYYLILIFSIYWSNKSFVIELLSRQNVKNLEICGLGWLSSSPISQKRYDSAENGLIQPVFVIGWFRLESGNSRKIKIFEQKKITQSKSNINVQWGWIGQPISDRHFHYLSH